MPTYRCKICLTFKEKVNPFASMPHDLCLFKFMITIPWTFPFPCASQWESPRVRDIHKMQD
jgi:hypothetical protein